MSLIRKGYESTYHLAGLPELNDADDLLSGHDRQGQRADELRPRDRADVLERPDDRAGEVGSELVQRQVGEQTLNDDGRVDRRALVVAEVGADEEDLVEEAEEEQYGLASARANSRCERLTVSL